MFPLELFSLGGVQLNLLLACANHTGKCHGEGVTRGWNIPGKLKLSTLKNVNTGFAGSKVKHSNGPLLIISQIGGSPKLLQGMRLSQQPDRLQICLMEQRNVLHYRLPGGSSRQYFLLRLSTAVIPLKYLEGQHRISQGKGKKLPSLPADGLLNFLFGDIRQGQTTGGNPLAGQANHRLLGLDAVFLNHLLQLGCQHRNLKASWRGGSHGVVYDIYALGGAAQLQYLDSVVTDIDGQMLLGRPRQLAEDIGFFHFKDFRHALCSLLYAI